MTFYLLTISAEATNHFYPVSLQTTDSNFIDAVLQRTSAGDVLNGSEGEAVA